MTYSIQDFGLQHVNEPLPVFTNMIKNHIKLNECLKQVIIDYRERYPQTSNTNVKAWHSKWTTHLQTNKFQPLINEVINACSFISKEYYRCGNVEFNVIDLWAIMYEQSDYTVKHHHFPNQFAACYYVDVEDDCSPIVFGGTLTITPKSGMLIIWPGLLHHEVPPTNSRRTVIGMNILNKFKMNYE